MNVSKNTTSNYIILCCTVENSLDLWVTKEVFIHLLFPKIKYFPLNELREFEPTISY